MYSMTVDAGVLATPALDCHRDEVYQYLETLLKVEHLRKEEWATLTMSQEVVEVLANDDIYPDRLTLQKLLDAKDIEEYDANTVAQMVLKLLSAMPTFEDYFRVNYVLTAKVITKPKQVTIPVGDETTAHLQRCMVLLALLQTYCTPPLQNHTLIVRGAMPVRKVSIRTMIHAIEHQRDDITPFPEAPDSFEGTVNVCGVLYDLIGGVDLASAWRSARGEEERIAALRIALYQVQLTQGDEPKWDDTLAFQFRFGRKFIERADRVCADGDSALVGRMLRSMVETLLGQRLGDVHDLRINGRKGSPQRIRGTDTAWRRDIDREFHLHYWECDKGLIEFGWIGPHNDFELPE